MTSSAFYPEPQPLIGGTIPFLEKFSPPDASQDFYSYDQLLTSIEAHLKDILSTRCSAKQSLYEYHTKNPLSPGLPFQFGLPDMIFQLVVGRQSWKKWEKIIQHVIETYEPRLKSVCVSIVEKNMNRQTLILQIKAKLQLKQLSQNINFPLSISL